MDIELTIQVTRRGAPALRTSGGGKAIIDPVEFAQGNFVLRTHLPNGAGGTTIIDCKFLPDEFHRLAFAMMKTSPQAATKAFASALMARDPDENLT